MTANIDLKACEMLTWSFDFIKHNRKVTTEQIPDELIEFWSIPDFTTNPTYKADDTQIVVFLFIARVYQVFDGEIENLLNSFRFNQLFYNFQIVLAVESRRRRENMELKPFPIFDLKNYIVPNLGDPQELLRQYQVITERGG